MIGTEFTAEQKKTWHTHWLEVIDIEKEYIKQNKLKLKELNGYLLLDNPPYPIQDIKDGIQNVIDAIDKQILNIEIAIASIREMGFKYINFNMLDQLEKDRNLKPKDYYGIVKMGIPEDLKEGIGEFFTKFKLPLFIIGGFLLFKFIKK